MEKSQDMKLPKLKPLHIAGLVVVAFLFFRGRNGNGNGGTGEVVYLHASDGYGLVGLHQIVDKSTGTVMGIVNYEPNVYSLVSGKTYQYTSTGNYSAQLKTSWASWPEKPVNTRAVGLTITSGSTTGTANGVAFEFRLT